MSHDYFKFTVRRCAKCGSEMYATKTELATINWIPYGSWIYFSCLNCGKEIKLKSRWCFILELIVMVPIALLLLGFSASLLFFVAHKPDGAPEGIFLVAILFFFFFLYILISYRREFYIRKQNPEIPHMEATVELEGKRNVVGWMLIILTILLFSMFTMIGLFDTDISEKKVNETSTVQVELVGGRVATVEGRYFLRFDNEHSQYSILKKNAEEILLSDWEVRVPETLRILKRNVVIRLIKHETTSGRTRVESQVYEIKTTFTIATVPAVAISGTTYNMVAGFPAALAARQVMKASTPSSVPEIHFNIKYHARNSDVGLAHIGKNFGFTILFALASVLIVGIGVRLGEGKLTIGILSATDIVGTLYYLFLTLKDFWWIISRLWGG